MCVYVYMYIYIYVCVYIYMELNYFAVQQKLTHHCKSTTLQLEKRKKSRKPPLSFWNIYIPKAQERNASSPRRS